MGGWMDGSVRARVRECVCVRVRGWCVCVGEGGEAGGDADQMGEGRKPPEKRK